MTTENPAPVATQTETPAATDSKPARKPRATKAAPKKAAKTKAKPAKAKKTAKPTKAAGPKAKSKKAGTVVVVKRSRDFKRIKRIGDKEHKVDLTKYATVISAGGNSSLDNGDEVAQLLRGKTVDEVYKVVAKHTEESEEQLRHNYGHLNAGMQRMNLGNKLRAALGSNDEE